MMRAKPTRLWLRPAEGNRRAAVWIIKGPGVRISTGCIEADRAGAERKLAEHIAVNSGEPVQKIGPAQAFLEAALSYDGDECLTWPFSRFPSGYAKLGKGTAHRVICEKVYGPPPTPDHEAAHSCGKGKSGCINRRHLRWATHTENQHDRRRHGTLSSPLTEHDVLAIRALELPQMELVKQFGVGQSCISAIRRRKTWAWLQP
jgi:hypothetical protein